MENQINKVCIAFSISPQEILVHFLILNPLATTNFYNQSLVYHMDFLFVWRT